MSRTPAYIADLLFQLLEIDKIATRIDNGTLTITQDGKSISLPINNNSVIRSSISRF